MEMSPTELNGDRQWVRVLWNVESGGRAGAGRICVQILVMIVQWGI